MARPRKKFVLNEQQQKMVMENIKLVPWFMKKYCFGWMKIRQNEMPDLEQELYIGLCRAAYDFNPDKGGFATLAIWWMRSSVAGWARKLPPLHIGTITESVRTKEEKRNYEIERWRIVLARLSDRKKNFLECTRPTGVSINSLRMGRETYLRHQDKVILELRKNHVG